MKSFHSLLSPFASPRASITTCARASASVRARARTSALPAPSMTSASPSSLAVLSSLSLSSSVSSSASSLCPLSPLSSSSFSRTVTRTHMHTSTSSTPEVTAAANSDADVTTSSMHGEKVRVRFAPSPTGSLHLGGLRTALYNYLYAKKMEGQFLLRIEDTDQTRLVDGSAQQLQDLLHWAGLNFDEGPGKEGGCGPYVQSQRKEEGVYRQHAMRLVEQGDAYPCFCSAHRLQSLRTVLQRKGLPSLYDRKCMGMDKEEARARMQAIDEKREQGINGEDEQYVIRMRIPEGSSLLQDEVMGSVSFAHKSVDDQVLLKSDGFPTYHLAVVVDDHLMQISHVIRGQEWLPSTIKHHLLYRMFDWPLPKFVHLPLLLDQSGAKLSKRHASASVNHYIEQGFEPQAVLNFVALLGWSAGSLSRPHSQPQPQAQTQPPHVAGAEEEEEEEEEELFFTLDHLATVFGFGGLQRSGAMVNVEKLEWVNQQHLRYMIDTDARSFAKELKPEWEKVLAEAEADVDVDAGTGTGTGTGTGVSANLELSHMERVLRVLKDHVTKRQDIIEDGKVFFIRPDFSEAQVQENKKEMWTYETEAEAEAEAEVEVGVSGGGSRVLLQALYTELETLTEEQFMDLGELKKAVKRVVKQQKQKQKQAGHAGSTDEKKAKKKSKVGLKDVLFPLRFVLTGKHSGSAIYALASTLGREETLARMQPFI